MVEDKSIGWAWWQEKKMGVNNPLEIVQPQGYDKLVKYWTGKGDKPTPQEAWSALQQLLQNIKIENNIYHPDVTDAMFRQVASATAIPFKQHMVGNDYTILAADYDMGCQGSAYYDADTASYQYTPGVRTAGNRGWAYRNDGVDIENGNKGPFVSYIEAGEWLQYTLNVAKPSKYNISFEAAADSTGGLLTIIRNEKQLGNIAIQATPSKNEWQWTNPQTIALPKGISQLKIKALQGGYRLSKIRLVKL